MSPRTAAEGGIPGPSRDRCVGILGGGQLGRMLVHVVQRMGLKAVVLDPDPAAPAGLAADRLLCAPYDDPVALDQLAASCAFATTEFENVPASSLQFLAARSTVAPAAAAVRVCQHRALEKAQFVAAGVPCAAHARVESEADVVGAADGLFPGLLKTSQMGYDGKGQARVGSRQDLLDAWGRLGRVPCLLEAMVPIRCELSVVVARGRDGALVHLPVQQNLHRNGVLAVTQVPAPDADTAAQATAVGHARRLAQALDYVGVLCVEFFVLDDGQVLANEMAPRPHNSGHYSIEACDLSQFELQLRTLTGLPLVDPRLQAPAVMLNLLGDLWFAEGGEGPREPDWARVLELPGAHLHLYGKAEARRGRKMGHLTVTAPDAAQARAVAAEAARRLGLPAW